MKTLQQMSRNTNTNTKKAYQLKGWERDSILKQTKTPKALSHCIWKTTTTLFSHQYMICYKIQCFQIFLLHFTNHHQHRHYHHHHHHHVQKHFSLTVTIRQPWDHWLNMNHCVYEQQNLSIQESGANFFFHQSIRWKERISTAHPFTVHSLLTSPYSLK